MQSNAAIGNIVRERTQAAADNAARAQPRARIRIRVWDLPIRLFHWSLALAVTVAIATGKAGGAWMDIHGKAGLTIIGLVVFRVVWGFVGSTHARFRDFAPTPAKLRAYLQGRWQGAGHNPLGALSVFALLGLLALQAGTGLFSNDDIAFSGPYFASVSAALAERLTGWHHVIGNVLLWLAALHVVAIAFYFVVRKDNLVKPMLTGWKETPAAGLQATGNTKDKATDKTEDKTKATSKRKAVALAAAVLIAVAVSYIASGAGSSKSNIAAAPSAKPAW
jgi:cytochrome b